MKTANQKIKILHLEDRPTDAEQLARVLRKADIHCEINLVDSKVAYKKALQEFEPEIILSDHGLPSFDSMEALSILKQSGLNVPFILVTGTVSEEFAVQAMREGATDYLLKDRPQRLVEAVRNAIEKFRLEKEHIESQKLIEESEAKYRAFFENSIDGILLTVTDGKILAANPAACVMFQMTEEEICNVGRFGMIDSKDPRGKLLIEERQRTGRAMGELTFIRKDKSRFPGEISSAVFMDANGQKRTSMIIRDRTEQKRVEEKLILASNELQQLNSRLMLATRSAGMGIWDWDIVNGDLTWDKGMHQLYKIDTNQFGSIYDGWLARLHPEDRSRVNQEILMAVSGKKEYDTEFRIEWPDQSVHYIKATGVVERDHEGHGIRMIGMNWDITKSKTYEETIRKSEAMLRSIDANSADMICTISEDGMIIHASAACETILRYTPDELKGKRMLDFVYPEDHVKTMEAALHMMKGNPLNNFENRYVRKDGSVVPLVWSVRWDANDRIRYGVARDATEIKKAEKTIATERKRLSDLITNAPVSMCIMRGENHVFELTNSAYLQLTGKRDAIGKTVKEVFPEIAGQGFYDLLDRVYTTGQPFSANEMNIKLNVDGNGQLKDIYLNFLYQPYFNTEGKVVGIYYFGVDVTEQVLARKKIEESEKRYRQIIETAQEGIWVIDENEKTTFVNDKMCEILEYSREEMMGKAIYFFMDEDAKSLANQSLQKRKKGNGEQYQLKYISKSKRKIWANISANPLFHEDGTYKGALAMITDITEQKKTEEENKKLATVASLTVNAVIVTGAEGRINWVNKGFEKITEYSFDEVIGKKPGNLLQGLATDSTTISRMRESIRHGQGFREEVVNYSKSGRQYWVDIEVVPLLDSHNKVTGFMAIEQDITYRKKSEEETMALIDTLQKKNKDMQQFSYIVSHNLRSPIAKLMGLASIIKTENEEDQFLIQKIAEEAANLDEVVKDINLIVSARKSDKEKMEHVQFKTETLNVMQVFETEIEASAAIISYDFNEIKSVFTIKSYLYSILYNLISNAIKYRQPNQPLMIHIQSSEDEKYICLSVKDNGRGIDMEKNAGKIFGLYKRFHGNDIPGKGVGLHLVKAHAESLGGSVKAESKLNEGTEFKVYLPNKNGKIISN